MAKTPHVTAVISFCSNDWRFLRRCIEGVFPFCSRVIVTVCDHFFDGSPENYALLEEAFRQFPECLFISFDFHPTESYRPFSPLFPEHYHWRHEWHNTGRWLGYLYAEKEAEFLLFLDCDEIVETLPFSQWLQQEDLDSLNACRFASYWYFREAKFEALPQEGTGLLVRRSSLQSSFLWHQDERIGLFHLLEGEKKLGVTGKDGTAMIRHFSGVRTLEEFHKKLSTWGHHWERNWASLLEEEYSHPFSGEDFIRGYCYRTVPIDFDPLAEEIPSLPPILQEDYLKRLPSFSNVIYVTKQDAFRKDVEVCCNE